jgi:hypothetical protein
MTKKCFSISLSKCLFGAEIHVAELQKALQILLIYSSLLANKSSHLKLDTRLILGSVNISHSKQK